MKIISIMAGVMLSALLVSCSSDEHDPMVDASSASLQEVPATPDSCQPADVPPGLVSPYDIVEVKSSLRKDGSPRRTAIIGVPEGVDHVEAFAEIAAALLEAKYVSKKKVESDERIQETFVRSGLGSIYLTFKRKPDASPLLSLGFPDQCSSR